MNDLTQRVEVETPELVVLSYTIAGVGSRVYAGFIDLLVIFGMIIGVTVSYFVVTAKLGFGRPDVTTTWAMALIGFASFAILWGYYVLCEWLADGQTLGKRWVGLRTVRDGGFSIGLGASATRNVMRAIDMQPAFLYLVGITSLAMSKSGKRLGDMVAGTIVIRERLVESPLARPIKQAVGAPALVALLGEEEFHLLERWYSRRLDIEAEKRKTLTAQVAARVRAALPQDDTATETARLIRLYESERRARDAGVAGRNETGAARERYAIVSTNSPRWLAFASRVADAQRHGISALGEQRVREFVAEYRGLSSDLARLQTASKDVEAAELFYLGRLVGAAHNLLYRDRRADLNEAGEFLFREVPREVRRSFRPILLATVALFLPLAIALTAVVRSPDIAPVFIPPSMLDRAEEGIKRAKDETGYIQDPQMFRPVLASRIISNNIQVTFMAFAGGITAGIATLLALALNGISFGGVLGLYSSKGILPLIIAFVAPHGVLELTAICIAGGGGFLIAAALLLPGKRTRRRALAENGRRAIRLISASTLLLVIAGAIEGMISPIPYWPLSLKLLVSGATAVFLVVYLRGGRERAKPVAGATTAPPAFLGLS